MTGTTRPRMTPTRAQGCEAEVIARLVSGQTVAAVATATGLSRRTISRIKSTPLFGEKFDQAKAELLQRAIADLSAYALAFTETLRKIALDEKQPGNARVGAAREGLRALYSGLELFDLAGRVAALEKDRDASGSMVM